MPWDGPHKRILFESEDPESTLSGSGTQETRPGWPPDDICADSTRYRVSFDDRDREGLRLLSPMFQQKVLKLQRDLEEAKAESRYFRARQVENPVIAPNRPRFTSTPVPRYAGGSNWDQYREVFEAIVCSNGWDEMTAALQLIAHLDGKAMWLCWYRRANADAPECCWKRYRRITFPPVDWQSTNANLNE